MAEFKTHHVVHDVLDTWPTRIAQFEYDAKNNVDLGNELQISHLRNKPAKIWWWNEKGLNDRYTLMMVDPDAPSKDNPDYRHFLHWLVVNIAPYYSAQPDHINVNKGHTLMEYLAPSPTAGTGRHRYVFIVYKQPHPLEDAKLERLDHREKFNIGGWLKKMFPSTLNKCELDSGNFFYAQDPTSHKHNAKQFFYE